MTSEEKIPPIWKNKEFVPFIFLNCTFFGGAYTLIYDGKVAVKLIQ
ncbi:hypothetical protein [Empedobacter stercoris]